MNTGNGEHHIVRVPVEECSTSISLGQVLFFLD
jgi:hypothetical protein